MGSLQCIVVRREGFGEGRVVCRTFLADDNKTKHTLPCSPILIYCENYIFDTVTQ